MTAPASLIFLADWSLFLPELDKQSKKLSLCVSASTSFRGHSLFLHSWCGFSILPSEFLVLLCFAFSSPLLLWFTCCCLTWKCVWYVNNLFLRTLTCAPWPPTLMAQGFWGGGQGFRPSWQDLAGLSELSLLMQCWQCPPAKWVAVACRLSRWPVQAGAIGKGKPSLCVCAKHCGTAELWFRAGLWCGSTMWIVPRFQLSLA